MFDTETPSEALGLLRSAHRDAAAAQAAEIDAISELSRRSGGVSGKQLAAEVAPVIGATEAAAAILIQVGQALDNRLPATKAAFAAGQIDLPRVRVIVDVTAELPNATLSLVEAQLAAVAATTNPAGLRQAATRVVIRAAPAIAAAQRELRESARSVSIRTARNGMATVQAQLPALTAQTLNARLREMSLQVCQRDPRTKAQRRADAIEALANGAGRLICQCGRGQRCPAVGPAQAARKPLAYLAISAESLAGLSPEPGYLAGYGPIDAALGKSIVNRAALQYVAGSLNSVMDRVQCTFPGCVAAPEPAIDCAWPPLGEIALCHSHFQLSQQKSAGNRLAQSAGSPQSGFLPGPGTHSATRHRALASTHVAAAGTA